MICCVNCFRDVEIKSIIKALNKKGACPICNKQNTFIYNTDINDTNIIQSFESLLDIYTPLSNLPVDFPKSKLSMLKDDLCDRWEIFNIGKEKVHELIKSLCKERYSDNPDIFDTPVVIVELEQEDYLSIKSLLGKYEWEDFVKEIKFENRFHTEYLNKEIFFDFCESALTKYKRGTVFYRGRISGSSTGFQKSNMNEPPLGKATGGRINPSGISCLYLANDEDTAIHEVRAGVFDYITIAKFKLLQDIYVVDFMKMDTISAFSNIDPTLHAVNKGHLKKICTEIAKPLRREDSHLDYLPTQYISDFIKRKGFQGIQYKSTLCNEGFNIAAFSSSLFKCTNVDVFDIKQIEYNFEKLDKQ